MTLEWTTDVAAGDWWVQQLRPFASGVGSLVPDSFEAVTRVFHPIEIDGDTQTTWSAVAQSNGRIAHAEMQLHAIATPVGQAVPAESRDIQDAHDSVGQPSTGALPGRCFERIASRLTPFTSTPTDLCFGFWEGYGGFTGGGGYSQVGREVMGVVVWGPKKPTETSLPASVVNGPRIKAPSRNYLLATGTAADIDELRATDRASVRPNMWWPADRAWFVATEIDFDWTYVGGTTAAIEAVEADDELESFRTAFDHQATSASDRLNT